LNFEFFRNYLLAKGALTDEQFDTVSHAIQERTVAKGTVLLRQDEICSEVYFVANGLLRSYTVDDNGREHIIQFAPEDSWISDRNSFLFGEPSLIFIDTIEESKLVVLTPEFFQEVSAFAGFNLFNTKALHNLVRMQQHRISLLIGASAEARYLDFVERYPSLTLRVPQWMIASYLGITPESLSRVRRELARRNFKPGSQSAE
jgi:CRP-like cAMP-binding protein